MNIDKPGDVLHAIFESTIGAAVGRRRRVPVLLQMTNVECGAACLAMILTYHGRKTRVVECRDHLGIGRDGLAARSIVDAARSYGLQVKAYSAELVDLTAIALPAIIHWKFNHYLVVERWSPRQVVVVDPALGRRQLGADEFASGFTGVVLAFEPGPRFNPRHTTERPSWRDYLRRLLHLPGMPSFLAQVLVASLLLQLFGLIPPTFTAVLIDGVLPLHMAEALNMLGLGIVLLLVMQIVTQYLRATLLIHLQARLDSHVMLGFFEHLLALPFRFFQQRTSGDLLLRLGSNTVIREMLTGQALSIALDGTFVLLYLAILLVRAPWFGLLVCGFGLLQIALLLLTNHRVRALTARDLAAQAESQGYLVEALTSVAMVKAAGAEKRVFDHWSNLFSRQLHVSLQRNYLAAIVNTGVSTLRTFSPVILLWVGVHSVLANTMSLGTMLALNMLAVSFLTPLASLVTTGQQLQLVGAYIDRVADVLEATPEQELRGVRSAPQLTGRIELTHVSFRYSPTAPLVLHDVSLVIEPGKKVALVGPTGSGKSTLVLLLLGLYTPVAGDTLYDDIPLRHLDRHTLRSQFGVVLQESFLFSGAIRQNIAFNDPDLPFEQVAEAARLAAIDDEIARMPMGYETLVTEGGGGLSGGQRQRLSLARAIAHKPAFLLLDEATSHLDVQTESVVERNLGGLSCTRVVVAHRLSTVRDADLILVLKEGAIVERGTHDELLARDGYYTELIRSQLECGAHRRVRDIDIAPATLPPARADASTPGRPYP